MPCTPSRAELIAIKQRTWPLVNQLRLKSVENDIENANIDIYQKYKLEQAIDILEKANEIFSGNLAIAFSGGKDSLVALHLSLKVNRDIPVLFNNTGIEYPETLEFVKRLSKTYNFDLHIVGPEINFFKEVKKRGWATNDHRWCCEPLKDEPAHKFLMKNNIYAEITGTSRTESIYRRSLQGFKIPKKSPFIIRVNPIYDWNQWEVWTYIRANKLPYNPLYDKGYRRIGCWCCPLNGPSHYKRLRKTHPQLYNFLLSFEPRHPRLQTF